MLSAKRAPANKITASIHTIAAMSAVKYAVIPVGGLGTRFLPVTKAVAKELLPIGDRPVIQYAVEECARAGIEQIVLVTNRLKTSLIDYLERDEALERLLVEMGKEDLLPLIRNTLPGGMNLINVRQSSPRGLGDAILCARSVVGDEPFVVLLPDDVLLQSTGDISDVLQRMIALYEQLQCSVVAVEEVEPESVSSYGIIEPGERLGPGYMRLQSLVEKPRLEDAPSRTAVVGRYLFAPGLFDHLAQVPEDAGGEVQLTPAISALAPNVVACDLNSERYDCGSRRGFLRANLASAMQDPELVQELRLALARSGRDEAAAGEVSATEEQAH